MSKKTRKIFTFLIVLFFAFIFIWFIFLKNSQFFSKNENEELYKTIAVETGSISNSISVIGAIESLSRAEVKSEMSGKIVDIFIHPGETVDANQPLLQLDTRELKINLQKLESQLKSAQAELNKLLQQPTQVDLKQAEANYQEALIALENAERTRKRNQELFTTGGVSLEQLEQSEDQVVLKQQAVHVTLAALEDLKQQPKKEDIEIRRAHISEVKASISSVQIQLTDSLIKAPIAGTVIDVPVKSGDFVQSGSILVIIDDMNTMKVVVPINEIDIPRIQKGMKTRVILDALPEKTFHGELNSISYFGEIIDNIVTYDATVLIPNSEGIIRPEMTADVEIITQYKEKTTIIPLDALIERNGKEFVLIANNEGNPIEKEVQIGIRNDSHVEIIEGVNAGDTIILPSVATRRTPPPIAGGPFGGGGR